MTGNLFIHLAEALSTCKTEQKLVLTAKLASDWRTGQLELVGKESTPIICGRPPQPPIVNHRRVPQGSPATPEGRARLLHAIAHIEFTAINLALDHALRFQAMPEKYYSDWIGVAAEEAEHFQLLRNRLRALGHDYGDFPAHGSLWDMAERTAHDVLHRMALVPRLLEARGLDATPPIQKRLVQVGDHESASALDIILRDEIGHVGLGDYWFRQLCAQRGLPAEQTYLELLEHYKAPRPQTPMNEAARLQAGFSTDELAALTKKL